MDHEQFRAYSGAVEKTLDAFDVVRRSTAFFATKIFRERLNALAIALTEIRPQPWIDHELVLAVHRLGGTETSSKLRRTSSHEAVRQAGAAALYCAWWRCDTGSMDRTGVFLPHLPPEEQAVFFLTNDPLAQLTDGELYYDGKVLPHVQEFHRLLRDDFGDTSEFQFETYAIKADLLLERAEVHKFNGGYQPQIGPNTPNAPNASKLFSGSVPSNPDVVDLMARIDAAAGTGKQKIAIAREMTKESVGNDRKAQSLVSAVNRELRKLRTKPR